MATKKKGKKKMDNKKVLKRKKRSGNHKGIPQMLLSKMALGKVYSLSEILRLVPHRDPQVVRTTASMMANKGLLDHISRGKYSL